MFSNNNYLPDLNHFPPTPQLPAHSPVTPPPPPPASLEPLHPAMPAVTGSTHLGHFRFLSPTQGTAVPTWMPATCYVGTVSAPGTGASWQHSVPLTMPWANHVTPHFTAQNMLPPSVPVYTSAMGVTPQTTMMQVGPKPSIRCLRLKRRYRSSSIEESDGPSSKRFLSEKMATWFKTLQITPTSGQGDNHQATDHDRPFSAQDNGWRRFHEVEKQLGEDLEEGDREMWVDRETPNGVRGFSRRGTRRGPGKGAVLTIPDDVKKEVHSLDPVLPAQIMKTITNPCMDLVLWKPPESLLSSCLPVSPLPDSLHSQASTYTNGSSSSVDSLRTASNNNNNNNNNNSAVQSSGSYRSCSTPGAFFSAGITSSSGSAADMDSMEFYDCVDDDMDL